jgi:hypothetical protein
MEIQIFPDGTPFSVAILLITIAGGLLLALVLWVGRLRDPVDRLGDFSDLSKLADRIEVSTIPEIEGINRFARDVGIAATEATKNVERAFAKIPKAMSVFEVPSGIRIEKPRRGPPGGSG